MQRNRDVRPVTSRDKEFVYSEEELRSAELDEKDGDTE